MPLDAMVYRAAYSRPPPLKLGGAPVAGAITSQPTDFSRGTSTLLRSPVDALRRRARELQEVTPIAEEESAAAPGAASAAAAPRMSAREVASLALSGGDVLPPPPPKLKFFASWVQGAQHRKMSLAYDTATKECEVRLDGQAAAFVVSLKDGKGTPLEAIDLRIGRAVDVLGRRTTLQQAAGTTVGWLANAAWALDEAQQVLEASLLLSGVCPPPMLHSRDAVISRTGTTSLRELSRRTKLMQSMWRDAPPPPPLQNGERRPASARPATSSSSSTPTTPRAAPPRRPRPARRRRGERGLAEARTSRPRLQAAVRRDEGPVRRELGGGDGSGGVEAETRRALDRSSRRTPRRTGWVARRRSRGRRWRRGCGGTRRPQGVDHSGRSRPAEGRAQRTCPLNNLSQFSLPSSVLHDNQSITVTPRPADRRGRAARSGSRTPLG